MNRLDRVQVGLWDKAMNGDAAAKVIVRIIAGRSRLLGLGGVTETERRGPRTVVVPAEDRESSRL